MRSATWGQSPKGWTVLSCDVNWEDYGGTWCKRDKHAKGKRVYHVLRFRDLADYDKHFAPHTYEASTAWVDLDDTKPEIIKSALDSCGFTLSDSGNAILNNDGNVVTMKAHEVDLVILDALAGYGLDWDDECDTKAARLLRARAIRGL